MDVTVEQQENQLGTSISFEQFMKGVAAYVPS
jgi:hypothetical protein